MMKMTAILLMMSCLQVSAKVSAQRINLKEQNVSLKEIFRQVERQSDYFFIYRNEWIRNAGDIDVHLKNATIEETMTAILDKQPLTWSIVNKNIVIRKLSKKEKTDPAPPIQKLRDLHITGNVKDSVTGDPLFGVTIKVKGATTGTTTDINGDFSLDVPGNNAVLEITYLGYNRKEVSVGQGQTLQISLSPTTAGLEQFVVTGYRSIKKRLFSGSSSTLSADDVERPGMSNISQMLEGEFAGVSMQNVSGTFGAAPKLRIRGATSLSGDNKPLWVIDGIIQEDVVNISNEALSTGDMNTLLGSSVAGINPSDIQDITILRDAAATALYGARAMNGVVVITTKKGRATSGKPRINYTMNLTRYIKPSYANFDILNSADQMAVMVELLNKGYYQMPGMINGKDGGVFNKMYQEIGTYDPATKTYKLRNDQAGINAFLERYANANTDWFDIIFKIH